MIGAILITPQPVAAEFLEVTSPAEIYQDSAFEIDVKISAQPNSSYHIKARLGQSSSTLSKGQTFDQANGVWLSDTVSWDKFPSLQTDSDGSWNGKLKVKSSATAVLGTNLLQVRIQKEGGTSKYDSPTYSVTLLKPVSQDLEKVVAKPPKLEGKPVLSEFMAQPLDKVEWVEIRNDGDTAADISGWKIDDDEGKSSPQTVDDNTIIPAKSYFVLNFSSFKLNDLADSVRLLKSDDSVVDSFSYTKTIKGQSWAKDKTNNWFITNEPTPGAENKFTYISETPDNPATPIVSTTTGSETVLAANEKQATSSATMPNLNKSQKIATVSSSFINKENKNNFSNLVLFIAGGLLLFASVVIVFKGRLRKFFEKKKAPNVEVNSF